MCRLAATSVYELFVSEKDTANDNLSVTRAHCSVFPSPVSLQCTVQVMP